MNSRSAVPLCRHTKTDGRRCQSPAMATSAFCYFHQKTHRARRRTPAAGPGLSTQVLHPLRSAHSIQQAIAMVVNGLATGQIHTKQGGKMIYALQLAMTNRQNT